MNKYTNGTVVINATEKAYNVIYQKQGFKPYDALEESSKLAEKKKIEAEAKAKAESKK